MNETLMNVMKIQNLQSSIIPEPKYPGNAPKTSQPFENNVNLIPNMHMGFENGQNLLQNGMQSVLPNAIPNIMQNEAKKKKKKKKKKKSAQIENPQFNNQAMSTITLPTNTFLPPCYLPTNQNAYKKETIRPESWKSENVRVYIYRRIERNRCKKV